MNILDTIIARKKMEIAERKKTFPETWLKEQLYFNRVCLSLSERLLAPDSTGIITEFKRKSPSRGFINEHADAATITMAYTKEGAAGLSVLTDGFFFGGTTVDLLAARVNNIPILRKDFIIDAYQVTETKAMGADVILLIAACLSPAEVQSLAKYAVSLGLEVLLELHETTELAHICDEITLVGINNRNLKDFTVNINASIVLGKLVPPGKIKIAESGINDPDVIGRFRDEGFNGFLIGETFMKESDPAVAFGNFVKKLQ